MERYEGKQEHETEEELAIMEETNNPVATELNMVLDYGKNAYEEDMAKMPGTPEDWAVYAKIGCQAFNNVTRTLVNGYGVVRGKDIRLEIDNSDKDFQRVATELIEYWCKTNHIKTKTNKKEATKDLEKRVLGKTKNVEDPLSI